MVILQNLHVAMFEREEKVINMCAIQWIGFYANGYTILVISF